MDVESKMKQAAMPRAHPSTNKRVPPSSVPHCHRMARLRRSKAGCWARDTRRPYLKRLKAWDKAVKKFFTKRTRAGWIYVFFDGFFDGNAIFKLGKTNDLFRRIQEWDLYCPNPDRIWLEAFWVLNAIRTGNYQSHRYDW